MSKLILPDSIQKQEPNSASESGGTPLVSESSPSPTDAPAAESAPAPLEELRPELKPIAERHGRELLEFAIRVAGANVALDVLVTATKHNMPLRQRVAALIDAQTYFCAQVAESKGWPWDKVVECIEDIGRAAKIARAGPAGVQMAPGGKLVQ